MLVLTRNVNQKVIINGELTIMITSVQGNQVKLSFDGDKEKYVIHRLEIHEKLLEDGAESL